jgi:Tfp pilus assembly protein PilN
VSTPTLTLLPPAAAGLTTVARPPRSGQRTLTVSVSGERVRVVAFRGTLPVAWGTLERASGALVLPALRRDLAGRGDRVVDMPFYSTISRYMPQPAVARKHLPLVVEAEIAGLLPFEQDEADVRWSAIQTPRGAEVAVTGMPRWSADAHLNGVRDLGMRPTRAHTRAVALALAAGRADCVGAWLEDNAADLVLVRDGIPRLTHRVELPAGADAQTWAATLAMGASEVCAGDVPAAADDAPAGEAQTPVPPLVLMGDAPTGERLSALAHAHTPGVLPAENPLAAAEGFDPSAYAVNVGLLLAAQAARTRGRRGALGRALALDLLPERHRHHPKVGRQPLMAAAVGLVLLAGAGQLYVTVDEARAEADTLEARVVSLETQARVSREGASAIERLRARIPVVAGQADALEERMALNADAATRLRERIAAVTTAPPMRGATVTELTLDAGSGRLAGTATTVTRALLFTEALRESGLFGEVSVRDLADVSSGMSASVRFTLDLALKATAP